MHTGGLQAGKTRWTHYLIGDHLVWIPKYRRKIVTGEVEAETKRLLVECCERQGLTLLALETDMNHVHVLVSAPPRFSPLRLLTCSRDIPRVTYGKSSRISKRCVGKITYGQVRTMLAQQEAFRQK
jgi:hypothetical protein